MKLIQNTTESSICNNTYKDDNQTVQDGVVFSIDAEVPCTVAECSELSWSLSQAARYFGVADADVSLCTNYEPDYQDLFIKGLFDVGAVPENIGCITFQSCTDNEEDLV